MTKAKIICRVFVPDEGGEYRLYDKLTADEKKRFAEQISGKMGGRLNEYFGLHPEEYRKI